MRRASLARRAFALPVALAGIVIVGSLIAGVFFAASQEFRVGHNALAEQRAFQAAELGLVTAVTRWDRRRNTIMAIGAVSPTDTVAATAGAYAFVTATRTSDDTFWLVSEGVAGGPSRRRTARRLVNGVYRTAAPSIPVVAALMTRGAVEVDDSSLVAGADSPPPFGGWSSVCAGGVGVAGVAAPDTASVCDGPCPGTGGPRITGSPPELPSPAASDSATYSVFGDESWRSLAARADLVLPGGALRAQPASTAGVCDRAAPTNFGDPSGASACGAHFPLVLVRGDLTLLPGSVGQGILLVEGDLHLTGAVDFVGVILVRDDVTASGFGNRISGSILAADANPTDPTRIAGGTTVAYSSCAVGRSARGASPLVRAKTRGWAELF